MKLLLILLLSLPLLAQTKAPEGTFVLTCKGTLASFACSFNGDPTLPVTDPVPVTPPIVLPPPVDVTISNYPPKTKVSSKLSPLAYSMDNRTSDDPWKLKAGQSLLNEFGVVVTRLTDETTVPNSSMMTQYYSNRNSLCGNNIVLLGDGGSTYVVNIVSGKVTGLTYNPDLGNLNVRQTYWHPTNCDALYMTAAKLGSSNSYELWKFVPSQGTTEKVRDFKSDVLKVLPSLTNGYLALHWVSPDASRMLFAVEKATKDAPGVVLLDVNQTEPVRVYSTNPLPSQYIPNLPASNFRCAGVGMTSNDGKYYTIFYNGSAAGVNTMQYVIPWQVDPRTYNAYSTNGMQPTYHGSSLNSGWVHVVSNSKYGKPLDPSSEFCKLPFQACAGNPNWWYTLRHYDVSKTPTKEGYPYVDSIGYVWAASGFHLMTTPDGSTVVNSTYQESVGGDDYVIKAPLQNEIFLTFTPSSGMPDFAATWEPEELPWALSGYSKLARQGKTVRLSGISSKPWLSSISNYWAQPHAASDNTGCRITFAAMNGQIERIDTFMLSGFCERP